MRKRQYLLSTLAAAFCALLGATEAIAFTARIVSGEKTVAYTRDDAYRAGTMTPYAAAIHRIILAEIKRTDLPFSMASPFVFIIRFDVNRRGQVVYLKILQGSNLAVANEYAELIIRQASRKFPPLPASHPGERVPFVLPINMLM